jgi:hypothetical protein
MKIHHPGGGRGVLFININNDMMILNQEMFTGCPAMCGIKQGKAANMCMSNLEAF